VKTLSWGKKIGAVVEGERERELSPSRQKRTKRRVAIRCSRAKLDHTIIFTGHNKTKQHLAVVFVNLFFF